MSAPRPALYLDWVPTANPLYIQQPSLGQKTTGWTAGEKPPFQYENWNVNLIDQWIQYLDGVITGGAPSYAANTIVLTTTGDVAISSRTLTNIASTTGVLAGHGVAGTGIPSGAYVVKVLSATSVLMSVAGTSNQPGTALVFSHYVAVGATIQAQLDQLDAVASSNRFPGVIRQTVAGTVTLTSGPSEPSNQFVTALTTAGAINVQLPNPALMPGFCVTVADAGGVASTTPITVKRFGSEKIALVASDFTAQSDGASWTFKTDGNDWFLS